MATLKTSKSLGAEAVGVQDGGDDVGDVDVGFALGAVAEDDQTARIGEQAPHEIEPDAVGLARPDHVAEAEDAAGEAEQGAIGGNERLAGELAGAIGRDRRERPVILVRFNCADIAIDAATRGIKDAAARRVRRIASTTLLVSSVPS